VGGKGSNVVHVDIFLHGKFKIFKHLYYINFTKQEYIFMWPGHQQVKKILRHTSRLLPKAFTPKSTTSKSYPMPIPQAWRADMDAVREDQELYPGSVLEAFDRWSNQYKRRANLEGLNVFTHDIGHALPASPKTNFQVPPSKMGERLQRYREDLTTRAIKFTNGTVPLSDEAQKKWRHAFETRYPFQALESDHVPPDLPTHILIKPHPLFFWRGPTIVTQPRNFHKEAGPPEMRRWWYGATLDYLLDSAKRNEGRLPSELVAIGPSNPSFTQFQTLIRRRI
jgi:hypothetical protein